MKLFLLLLLFSAPYIQGCKTVAAKDKYRGSLIDFGTDSTSVYADFSTLINPEIGDSLFIAPGKFTLYNPFANLRSSSVYFDKAVGVYKIQSLIVPPDGFTLESSIQQTSIQFEKKFNIESTYMRKDTCIWEIISITNHLIEIKRYADNTYIYTDEIDMNLYSNLLSK